MASDRRRSKPRVPCLSTAGLLLELRNFIDAHPPLARLGQINPCWPRVVMFCEELDPHRSARQALTLLHMRSQMEFERALFCAWTSLLVAIRLNLAVQHQRALFYAGLLQDVGKYLPAAETPGLPVQKPSHAPFGMDIFDAHPLASSVQMETSLPGINGLSELILYHHAREDGTGYPRQVGESQLPLDCQVLILANELNDRIDRLGGHNKLPQLLPGLRLGSLVYFERAHRGWLEVLEPLVCELDCQSLDRYQKVISPRRDLLRKLIAELLGVSAELLPYAFDFRVHAARVAIRKLARIVVDTGVISESIDADLDALPMDVKCEIELVLRGVVDFIAPCRSRLKAVLDSGGYGLNAALLYGALSLLDHTLAELRQPQDPISLFRF